MAQGIGNRGQAPVAVVGQAPHLPTRVGLARDPVAGVVAKLKRGAGSSHGGVGHLSHVARAVAEAERSARWVGDAGDLVAPVVAEGERSTRGVYHTADIGTAVVVDGDRVAGAVRDGATDPLARHLGEGVLDLSLGRERVGARARVVAQAVVNAGGWGEAAVDVLGEGVGKIVAPVDRGIARGAIDGEVDVEAMGPVIAQLGVVRALTVVGDGERDGQSPACGPADDGNLGELVSIARVGVADIAFPGVGGTRGGVYREFVIFF